MKIKLKSYNFAGQIATVLISAAALVIIVFVIVSIASGRWDYGDFSNEKAFAFVSLSIFALAIPVVLIVTVGRTLVVSHSFIIDGLKSRIAIGETNLITRESKEKISASLENFKELVVIRIKHDDDGIANQYHIFGTYDNGDPVKLFTFTKYHFALRFMFAIQENTDLAFQDWSEKSFDRESDFVGSVRSDNPRN